MGSLEIICERLRIQKETSLNNNLCTYDNKNKIFLNSTNEEVSDECDSQDVTTEDTFKSTCLPILQPCPNITQELFESTNELMSNWWQTPTHQNSQLPVSSMAMEKNHESNTLNKTLTIKPETFDFSQTNSTSSVILEESTNCYEENESKIEFPVNSKCVFKTDYMIKFTPKDMCNFPHCEKKCYLEHFHCNLCQKVFSKTHDAVRDIRVHEKQQKSLQYNFSRYGINDMCLEVSCPFKQKQTHYHCLENNCTQVTVTAAEMQVHFNSHQKIGQLKLEGFQRILSTERCFREGCPFAGEHTVHFHCIRKECTYSFKNRADMEKHKGHHAKNEELAKTGFRKFYKYETCFVKDCELSLKTNHVHCLQEGCYYLLNSVNMIPSHLRKHDRQNINDILNKNYMLHSPESINLVNSECAKPIDYSQKDNNLTNSHCVDEAIDLSLKKKGNNGNPSFLVSSEVINSVKHSTNTITDHLANNKICNSDATIFSTNSVSDKLLSFTSDHLPLYDSLRHIRPSFYDYYTFLKNQVDRFTANDACNARCVFLYANHYHCRANQGACQKVMRGKQEIREHGRFHAIVNDITDATFKNSLDLNSMTQSTKIFYCNWPDCEENFMCTDLRGSGCYQHIKLHLSSVSATSNLEKIVSPSSYPFNRIIRGNMSYVVSQKIKCSNKRKRSGIPFDAEILPKYHKLSISDNLPKSTASMDSYNWAQLSLEIFLTSPEQTYLQFKLFTKDQCIASSCRLKNTNNHFHCLRSRCYSALEDFSGVQHHIVNFHSQVTILEGFEAYNYQMDCQRPNCLYSNAFKHYHCTQDGCFEGVYRESTMRQHYQKHLAIATKKKELNSYVSTSDAFIPKCPSKLNFKGTSSTHAQELTAEDHQEMINSFIKMRSKKKTNGMISSSIISSTLTDPSSQNPQILKTNQQLCYSDVGTCFLPFCKLKRSKHYHCPLCNAGITREVRFLDHLRKHQRDSLKKVVTYVN